MSAQRAKPQSFLTAIWSSILWKGLGHLAGLLKHIIIASALGLTGQMDVFYMAIAFLGVFAFSWSRIVDVLAVPRLIQYEKAGDSAGYQQLAGGLFVLCLLFSGVLAIVLPLSWETLIKLIPGFDAKRSSMLRDAIPWLIPAIVFYIPYHFLGSLHRAKRQFSLIYQSEFLSTLFILLCIVLFTRDPNVLLWSFSAGVILTFLYLLLFSLRTFRPWGKPWSPEIRALIPLLPPLFVFYGANYVYTLMHRLFVASLGEGAISAVAYGWTLVNIIPTLMGLGGAFISIYAQHKDDRALVTAKINDLLSMTLTIGVPVTLFLFCFSGDFVGILLERGAFSKNSTQLVAESLAYFGLATVPLLVMWPLQQVFQVERRFAYLVRRVIIGLLLNLLFSSWFVFELGMGITGVALGTALSYWGMLASALTGIVQMNITLDFKRHVRWLLGLSLCYATILPLSLLLPASAASYYWLFPKIVILLLGFLMTVYLCKSADAQLARRLIRRSLRRE